jgi:hypothetical protein
MEALNIKEAAPCRCGGQVKFFGPCKVAPRSHWILYCTNDSCQQLASGDSLEDAIDLWNNSLEPIHA